MRILGLDTSIAVASAAISEDGQILGEDFYPRDGTGGKSRATSYHAEIILPLIDSVLRRARSGLPGLDGIAVSIGPGSFTGVRIGLSTVKGLAYGAGMSAVGISTLQAVAARVTGFEGKVCPILDAGKHEVYAAVFRKDGNQLKRLTEDAVMPVLSFLEGLTELGDPAPCLFIGEGVTAYRSLIQQVPELQAHIAEEDAMPSVAASVALLGESQFVNNPATLLGDLVPVYLRRPACESPVKGERK